jgi:hypothetical protein
MATTHTLTVYQNANLSANITVVDSTGLLKNLTGYTPTGMLRKSFEDTSPISFTCTNSDAVNGVINLALTKTQTGAMTANHYVYDVIITDSSNNKTRVLEGKVLVKTGFTG